MNLKDIKKSCKAIALALCAVMVLTSCRLPGIDFPFGPFGSESGSSSGRQSNFFEDTQRRTVPFEDMVYERPDADAILEQLAAHTQDIEQAGSFDELLDLTDAVGSLQEDFDSMHTLALIHTYLDSTDTYFEEELRYCEERGQEISNAISTFYKSTFSSSYREDLREYWGEYLFDTTERQFSLKADSVVELQQQRAALNVDYNMLMTTMTTSYNGKDYTYADIDALEDPSQRWTLREKLLADNEETVADLYRKLVRLDQQIAQTLGFDSAADMYYLSYSRDYTPQDVKSFYPLVKENVVPLVMDVQEGYMNTRYISAQMDESLNLIPDVLEKVDPEVAYVWDYMRKNNLFDYTPSSVKQSGAFTTYIGKYDAPFCFGSWDGSFGSVSTAIHEFGHFYDFWLRFETPAALNLDIAEVYSQGLEMVTMPHYGKFTKYSHDAQVEALVNLYDGVVYQSCLEEFQMAVYEAENLDELDFSDLFTELCDDYGLIDAYNPSSYHWMLVSHLFDAPFYTISYATSALTVLQLWGETEAEWEKAADAYIQLIHDDQDQPFLQLLESNGFGNPLHPGTVKIVALHYANFFDSSFQPSLPDAA